LVRDIREAIHYYMDQLREGESERAFFGLLELGPGAMPVLIAAASEPQNRDIRANLVEIIWQYRRPEAIGFLGTALDDTESAVSKQALDGLVALGGSAAAEQVREALGRSGFGLVRGVSKEWLSEALDQIVQCNVGANSTE
jgi:hypothetical protein